MTAKLTFEEWMAEVNRLMVGKCGMGSEDLPDWNYRDAYNDGLTPNQAANQAINAAHE